MGVTPLDFAGKGIRIDPRYLLIDRTVDGSNSTASTDGHFEKHFTMLVSGIYSFNQKVSVLASLPYSIRTGRENYGSPTVHTHGVGDIIISGRYKPVEIHNINTTYMLSVQGGIKFPTGKYNEKTDDGSLVDPHLQIGTGSYDFLLGTNFLFGFKKFALTSNFLYSIKTKGRTGYRFGNDLNYDITSRYKIFQSGVGRNMVMLNAGFYGEYKAPESQDDVIIDNTGGNTLYASGGVDYFITPYLLIGVQVQKPVYYHLYGIQDGETYRVKSGIQFLFY